MKIDKIVVGDLNTNCYILSINNECIIIDPADNYKLIKEKVNNNKILRVIITHSHFDHIGALDYFDKNIILDYHNLQEKKYKISNFMFEIIYTPGHKEDSITIYFYKEKVMFTGDFIFKNAIGRTDLPGGNMLDMINSLNKIKKYSNDIVIYPGHGESTTLESELTN